MADDLLARMGSLPVQDEDKALVPGASTAPAVPAAPAAPVAPAPGPSEEVSNLLTTYSHEVQVKLADLQADPNSPLYSISSFEDLKLTEALLKGIYKMGFQKPSKIQERALPLLMADPPRNFIGQSQSGTGKTAAFVLTMLSRIDLTLQAPQAVCLAPSRELAQQIYQNVVRMGEYTNVTVFFGGLSSSNERQTEPITAQIIVGTPGTVGSLGRNPKILDFSKVKVFVLDEADNMLETGSLKQHCVVAKRYVTRTAKPQIILFSATYPPAVREFAASFAPNANEISLKQEELSLDAIKQFFMDCAGEEQKYEVLVQLYSILTIGQSIIFVSRRDTADRIAARMTAEGHAVVSLHGQLSPEERDSVMASFREGKTKVLITTNVIARGIDVLQVNMVVNYDLPVTLEGKADLETYIHRIGRTGRFGRQGIAINFIDSHRSFENIKAIETQLGSSMTRVATEDLDVMEESLKKALKA